MMHCACFSFFDTSVWFDFFDPGWREPDGYDEEGRWEEAGRWFELDECDVHVYITVRQRTPAFFWRSKGYQATVELLISCNFPPFVDTFLLFFPRVILAILLAVPPPPTIPSLSSLSGYFGLGSRIVRLRYGLCKSAPKLT